MNFHFRKFLECIWGRSWQMLTKPISSSSWAHSLTAVMCGHETELWPVEGRQKWGTPPPEGSPKGTYPLFCTVLLSCGWLLMFAREWRTLKAYRHVRGGSRHESSLKGEPLGRTSNPHETAVLSGCGLFGVVYYSRCSVNYRKTYTNKIILSVCVHVMCACMLSHSVVSDSSQPHGLQHFSVLHCLPEFAQTQVHWVSDAIQPSHPLSSPSPPALKLSKHQGLF